MRDFLIWMYSTTQPLWSIPPECVERVREALGAGWRVLSVEEGALYPSLHRLQARGLLEAAWGRTETGRRAKFYELTKEGRSHLEAETARWNAYSGAVTAVLGETH